MINRHRLEFIYLIIGGIKVTFSGNESFISGNQEPRPKNQDFLTMPEFT